MTPRRQPPAPSPPRSLRIAMLGCKGIPAVHGGIERHVEEIARRLARRGHGVVVFNRRHHPYGEAHWQGVRILRRPSLNTKHLDAASHTALCSLEAVLSGSYDILHVHGIGPGLFLPWRSGRLRTVFTYHAQDWRQRKWGPLARWILRRGESWAIHRADALITVSRLLQRHVQERYGRCSTYIPNGAACPTVTADDVLARWGLQRRGYLLFVGRIIADRGLGTLLDAFAKLETTQRLVIVGEVQVSADEIQALRRRANGRVLFTGYQGGDALHQLYAHASLCVHPSEIEGLPIAVLEAMAHGRPVVVSDIAENLEAVGDAGLTFPVGNPDALRQRLRELLHRPDLAESQGERARQRVQRLYHWDDIARATEAVYLSVVHPGAPGALAPTRGSC